MHVVVIGIRYTCIAMRHKPAFISTWLNVGLSRRRPGFNTDRSNTGTNQPFLLLPDTSRMEANKQKNNMKAARA